MIFSAHGVAPSEWDRARDRGLRVIDATCPLVTKVHLEVERYARENRTVILVGHAGHEEVKGTLGVAPGRCCWSAASRRREVAEVPDPERVAAVTQTTLSVDDTREIMETLKRRFPAIVAPKTDDICYATQNRQNAVKELVEQSDAILVVGSKQSSNANRLVEVARMRGARAFLVDSLADVRADDARRRARARPHRQRVIARMAGRADNRRVCESWSLGGAVERGQGARAFPATNASRLARLPRRRPDEAGRRLYRD